MRPSRVVLALVLIVSPIASPLNAQTYQPHALEFLEGEIWAPFDPPLWEHSELVPFRPGDDEAIARIQLKIAQRVFSLMLWGGEMRYVPLDRARGIEEELELRPFGEIRWGDRQLQIVQHFIDSRQNVVITRFRYTLDQRQRLQRRPWGSTALIGASGASTVPWAWDDATYAEGIRQAIKEAIRAWLRERHFNKPREIRARFLLRDVPSFRLEAGQLETRVRLLMLPPEVRDYSAY